MIVAGFVSLADACCGAPNAPLPQRYSGAEGSPACSQKARRLSSKLNHVLTRESPQEHAWNGPSEGMAQSRRVNRRATLTPPQLSTN